MRIILNRTAAHHGDRLERVRRALRGAGPPDTILQRFAHEFAGGQRLAIAEEPKSILLNQPTSARAVSVQARIIGPLSELQDEKGSSRLFILRDLKVMRALRHRVVMR